MSTTFNSPEDYIAQLPEDRKQVIEELGQGRNSLIRY